MTAAHVDWLLGAAMVAVALWLMIDRWKSESRWWLFFYLVTFVYGVGSVVDARIGLAEQRKPAEVEVVCVGARCFEETP